MADEDCWAIRAQADALQSEVSTLRGAVAALRVARERESKGERAGAPAPAPRPRGRWFPLAIVMAFALGVALTLSAVLLLRAALCP